MITFNTMTKVKEFLKFFGYNSLFATALFLGAVKGMGGFMNLVSFLIWVAFILITLIYIVLESGGQELWAKVSKASSTPSFQIPRRILTVLFITTLVFYGHFLLAILYLATALIVYQIYERIKQNSTEGNPE